MHGHDDDDGPGPVSVTEILIAVDAEPEPILQDTVQTFGHEQTDAMTFEGFAAREALFPVLKPPTAEERHQELSNLLSMISARSPGARIVSSFGLPIAGARVDSHTNVPAMIVEDPLDSTIDELGKLAIEIARKLTVVAQAEDDLYVRKLLQRLKRKLIVEINTAMVDDCHDLNDADGQTS